MGCAVQALRRAQPVTATTTDHANSSNPAPRDGRVPIYGASSLRCRRGPPELGAIAPHPMQHHRHLPGEGDLRLLGPLTLGETHCPGLHWRPTCSWT